MRKEQYKHVTVTFVIQPELSAHEFVEKLIHDYKGKRVKVKAGSMEMEYDSLPFINEINEVQIQTNTENSTVMETVDNEDNW